MAVSPKIHQGFTLIESIIAIVILGLAMLTLSSFLYPQIAQSAKPFYEVRASALANSLMTEVLARNFDEQSDHNGGLVRCGEQKAPSCTAQNQFGPDNGEPPEMFNDVDDYIGCWYTTGESQSSCRVDEVGKLSDIFGKEIADDYRGFRAEISVVYDSDPRLSNMSNDLFKKITVVITASQYGDFKFVAHRGNY